MTAFFSAIDLSTLPPPDVIEALDFETIRANMVAEYVARFPEFSAVLESDPVIKLVEVFAYRELLLRARVNDAARAVLVSSAGGADLDNLAAFFGVERLEGESDARLRSRVVLAPEGYAAAGPAQAYRFHALTAAPSIKDATVVSPRPGRVTVTVMSRDGVGVVPPDVIKLVAAKLSRTDVVPLTDFVSVQSVRITPYSVDADLFLYPGPDGEAVRQAALAAVNAYATSQSVIGRDVTLSGLTAALHQSGVQRVALKSPASDIIVDEMQTASLRTTTVKVAGRAE